MRSRDYCGCVRFENFKHPGFTQIRLYDFRRDKFFQRFFNIVNQFVDYGVSARFGVFHYGDFFGRGRGLNIETNELCANSGAADDIALRNIAQPFVHDGDGHFFVFDFKKRFGNGFQTAQSVGADDQIQFFNF